MGRWWRGSWGIRMGGVRGLRLCFCIRAGPWSWSMGFQWDDHLRSFGGLLGWSLRLLWNASWLARRHSFRFSFAVRARWHAFLLTRSFGSLLGWFVRLQRPRWHPSSHSFGLMLGCFFGSSAFSHSFGPIDQLVSAGHVGMLASVLFAFLRRLAPLSYLGTWACSRHSFGCCFSWSGWSPRHGVGTLACLPSLLLNICSFALAFF